MYNAACPSCSGALPLSSWTPGRQLRCPRCTTIFRLGTAPGTVARVGGNPVVTTPPLAPAAAVPTWLGNTPTEPATAPTSPNRVWLLAGVVGGLLLFVGGTIGLAFLVAGAEARPGKPPPTIAQNNGNPGTPTPTPTPNPTAPPEPVSHPMPPPPPRRLPPELQAKVDAAIDKGLAFLRSHGQQKGGLFRGERDGGAFLAGLTMLECGVPTDDPHLAKLVARAREYGRGSQGPQTYDTALALLFLDRLGDPADKPLLQSLGLRLMAGQLPGGGWTYGCPALSTEAQAAFLAALQRSRPEKAGELVLRDKAGQFIDVTGKSIKEENLEEKSIKDIEAGYNKLLSIQDDLKKFPELQHIPSLSIGDDSPPAPRPNGKRGVRGPRRSFVNAPGDNSNTQFATLGLWVASRHDLPCERALALLAIRFRTSQGPHGGWGYVVGQGETAPMTCAGLLAVAVGHGIRVEDAQQKREDPQINTALTYLSTHLTKNNDALNRNFYGLWSLERVGVLFGIDKVGDTDWYEWGAKRLVAEQGGQGAWSQGTYPGASPLHDTCFALLFLKRANFVRDLSSKLDRVLDIKGTRRQE